MYSQAFSSSFLPASHKLAPRVQTLVSRKPRRKKPTCAHKPFETVAKGIPRLSLLATGIAAYSALVSKAQVRPPSPPPCSSPVAYVSPPHVIRSPSAPSNAVVVKEYPTAQHQDHRSTHSVPGDALRVFPSKGTLLQVEPSSSDPAPGSVTNAGGHSFQQNAPLRSQGASNYPTTPNASVLPEWAAAGVQRAIHSPDRLMRLRARVRPTTLGLVGVGAFTSGSMFLRSVSQKRPSTTVASPFSGEPITPAALAGIYSVVSMHIPFCAPERALLLDGLKDLADTASLVTAEGMAAAARDASALLLEESGLLEDSRKFAPHMDVFLADTMASAERRFSGHVVTEEHRIERICGKTVGYDVSPKAKLGQYGVVSLVIATAQGVDLECYDDHMTTVSRLRASLDSVCRSQSGDILGMELQWVPEKQEARSLTRAQMSDAYPFLRVI